MSGLIHEQILVETVEEPVVEPETVRTLRKVKELIKQGWTRGEFYRLRSPSRINPSMDRYCLLGALGEAKNGNAWVHSNCVDEVRLIEAAITVVDGGWDMEITRWNDAQKSKHKVLRTLDKAIELAR